MQKLATSIHSSVQQQYYLQKLCESVWQKDNCQVQIVDHVECLELIQTNQDSLIIVFYSYLDRAEQIQIALNSSTFHRICLPGS